MKNIGDNIRSPMPMIGNIMNISLVDNFSTTFDSAGFSGLYAILPKLPIDGRDEELTKLLTLWVSPSISYS